MVLRVAACISSGLGSGYVPRMPGTAGTLAGLLFWLLLSWVGVLSAWESHAILAVAVIVVGTIAVRVGLEEEGGEDPQWIVIDEWAGMFVALIGTDPSNALHLLAAFVGFRLFDIIKPGPVGMAEELPGAVGIVADDVVAGLLTLVGMVALRSF